MAKTREKYEVMYILNPNLSEEETAALVEKFKTLVEQNGDVYKRQIQWRLTEGSKAARQSKSPKSVSVRIAGCNPPA